MLYLLDLFSDILFKKNKIKNFMIEFLNVVIDVYVIFFYFKYYMFFKKWILDCSFYFLGVLGRFV